MIDLLLLWRLFSRDPKRHVVLFMGPKNYGKTELFSAVKGEEFDEDRPNSGAKVKPDRFDLKESDASKKLKLAVIDSGGEDTNIINICKKAFKYIAKKRPDHVLVVLVVDVGEYVKQRNSVVEHLSEYVSLISKTCEGQSSYFKGWLIKRDVSKFITNKYNDGYWRYMVVGTHGLSTDRGNIQEMQNLACKIEGCGVCGKIRDLVPRKGLCFELSDSDERRKARVAIMRAISNVGN